MLAEVRDELGHGVDQHKLLLLHVKNYLNFGSKCITEIGSRRNFHHPL